ncbi:hypothetical protein CJF42_14920 [Pseudoalteromonas sp. NBT06-2]|uniref:hypothetical protein n=1 Tax=Pseudoalteromonas sp. NBT06-2 TaxID=2025950 RepID=UPI000BA69576|nr:hypothetical protein [Pseudoalteromonas sp. NBT06-2]PAJ73597.1 hypothetical protein CJF42_14920 [Pseudoalteromonas sp. NBT06-2]
MKDFKFLFLAFCFTLLFIVSTPSEARYTKILTSMVEVTALCNYYNCTSIIDLGDGVEQYKVIYEEKPICISNALLIQSCPDPDRDET